MTEGRPWPSTASLIWGQIRYQNHIFWRTPISAFFTLVLPVMFLVLFNLIFSGDRSIEIPGLPGPVSTAQFYAPSLAVFAAASATYTNLGINISIRRDEGVLKRVRGTPLPPWIYMAGAVGSSVWLASIATLVMMGLGVVAYDLDVAASNLPAAAVSLLVGVACFATLGLALAALAPSGTAAPAIANATLLPLAFISNIFVPLEDPPKWLETLGNVFPLRRFANAFSSPFNPFAEGGGWQISDLAVLVVWGVIGLSVALKFFRWEPHPGGTTERRRRAKAPVTAG